MAKSKTKEEYLIEANDLWHNLYDYNLNNYKSSRSYIEIYCHQHQEWFSKQAIAHLYHKQGCPKCGREKSILKQSKTTEDFKQEVKSKFNGFFDLTKTVYKNVVTNVIITCPIHSDFSINPKNFLKSSKGCPKCSFENMSSNFEEFQKKANDKHNNTFEYKGEYLNNKTPLEIICKSHGSFFQRPDTHLNGHGCPKCYKNISKSEIELGSFLTENGIKHKVSDKKLLNGLEVDILIESHKIAIEYNGLFWHREGLYRPVRNSIGKDYHLNKTMLAQEKGYRLIHIFEDEWINKRDIIESKVLHLLGKSEGIKLGARKCTIQKISYKTSSDFLNKYHIQGGDNAKIRYGAYYGDILVSVMTFLDSKDNTYKLNRFATNSQYQCVGLASKHLKHFEKEYNPSKVITFADRRFTLNEHENLYISLGFQLTDKLKPTYHYYNVETQEIKRYNREHFMKHKILAKNPQLDSSKTEKELMIELGYDRIWDCGNFKFEKIY